MIRVSEIDSREINEFQAAVLDYIDFKQAENSKPSYLRDLRQRLLRIGRLCEFSTLEDINSERLMTWFLSLSRIDEATGKSITAPSTRKSERKYISAFVEWLIAMGRMEAPNPADRLPRPKQKGDVRVKRRALKQEDIDRLLKVARLKPMAEYARRRSLRISNDRGGWSDCAVTFENIDNYASECEGLLSTNPKYLAQLKREGRHRELVYRVFMLSGMRRNELRTLTVNRIKFGSQTIIELDPANEKNSRGNALPIPADLAIDLKSWIKDRNIAPDGLVFSVPQQLVKTFHRDCLVAEIARKDGLGRQVDIHSLRYSYNMLLHRAKVEPRTRQKLMRHSRPDLTEVTYFDEEHLELAGAVESLPTLTAKRNEVQKPVAPNVSPIGLTPEEEMILAIYRNRRG